MKTNLLVATALLLSAVTFGQQTDPASGQPATAPENAQKGDAASVKSSTSADVKTGVGGAAENQAALTKKQTVKAGSSFEKNAAGQAKSAIDKDKGSIGTNQDANASIQVSSGANTGWGNNKLSQDASLNNSLGGSSSDAKNRMNGLSQDGKATEKAKINESLHAATGLKKEADKSVVATAANIKQSAKPQPVSFKMQSQIKTTAALKIK
ncbi:MAG: hypothetical protein M3N30_07905 [Bacteroidota bacterium]|nr:hypothetical protein [Bacteroidota bacterium]